MIKEILLENQAVLLSMALIIMIVAIRFYFWHMEMRELRMFGHDQKPVSKKGKHNYKRTTYADAA